MLDYAEIAAALRHCNEIGGDGCFSCPHFARCEEVRHDIHSTIHCAIQTDAADAIEELLNRDVVPTDFHESCLDLEIKKRFDLEKQIPHWISVEERLPEPGERVLVTNGSFICEAYLTLSGKWIRGGTLAASDVGELFYLAVTHWMPLPKPPEEE